MPRSALNRVRALTGVPFRGVRIVEFVFKRKDAAGDIYPDDPDRGVVAGPRPERVLFLGEVGELSLGVRTHELSLPAFFARHRAAGTGHGVEWSIASPSSSSVRDAPAVVVGRGDDLPDCDHVVVLLGITDSLLVISPAAWEEKLRVTIDTLLQALPRRSRITLGEIPPLDNAGSLSAPARIAAGIQGRALNARTQLVAQDYPSVAVVEFPAELTRSVWRPESEEHRYRDTYKVWGEYLASRIADVS
jgi:hypothetical protein